MLLDLNQTKLAPAEAPTWAHFDWEELARLWNDNDLAAAHDWLNERWSRLVRNRPGGQADPEAQFLQAVAFAVLALYFTQAGNQEGARLMLDDALVALGQYRPRFLGLQVDPLVDTLLELRPLIATLAPDAECPIYPFVLRKLDYDRSLPH